MADENQPRAVEPSARPNRRARVVLIVLLSLLGVGGVLGAILAVRGFGELAAKYRSTLEPQKYLPTIERAAAPLVEAIHRYESEVGHPPENVRDLVPAYLGSIPATGYPADPKFSYVRPHEGGWELIVYADILAQSVPPHFRYDPIERQWRFHPGEYSSSK